MKITYPVDKPYILSVAEVSTTLQANTDTGLSSSEAENRTKEFGLNSYQLQKQKSIGKMILQQFQSPIVYLLIVGAGVSLYFQDYIESIAIMGVVFINALIGFFYGTSGAKLNECPA
jgi:P-type Ca2+ transporter type 2C